MLEKLFGWMVPSTPVEYKPKPKPKEEELMVSYEYWPQFDNDEPTLEMAFKYYEENTICHIAKGGKTKCYFEYPERYYDPRQHRLTRI